MNKIFIYLVNIIIFISCNSYLFGFNWKITCPPPQCGDDWNGPKEALVCGLQTCADPACCYKIIYYDRWTGTNSNEYEINIAGVFWTDPACSTSCAKDDVVNGAYFPLLQSISNGDPTFRDRAMSTGRGPYGVGNYDNGTYIYIYSKANCKNSNEEQCILDGKCCRRKYGISFGGDPIPEYQVNGMYCEWWNNPEIVPPTPICPPPCVVICNDFGFNLDPDPCSLCNETYTWREMPVQSINIKCCPGCQNEISCDGCNYEQVTVYFIYEIRVGPYGSQCIFKDYRLKKWWFDDNSNHCSTFDEVKIHSKIYGWILNYGYLTNPAIDDSVTNVRMTEAECWHGVWKWDNDNPPHLLTVWEECENNTYCCQKTWKVKNYGPPIGVISSLLSSTPPGQQQCILDMGTMYQICQTFCESDPRQFWARTPGYENDEGAKINNENIEEITVNIIPNPTSGKGEIKIVSNYNGPIHVKFNNIKGDLIFEKTINKNSIEITDQLDLKNFVKGIYFYQVFIDGKERTSSKKLIID